MTNSKTVDENELLRILADGTAAETGALFFRALVKNFSQALGTCGAWVTEYLPEVHRLQALAFWLDGEFVDHYEYDVRGTPCEPTITRKSYLHIPDNVIDLFPADTDLARFKAVSYMGFPLLNQDRQVLGNLAVMDTRPMPKSYRNLAIFRIFAARATAELLRMRAESEIRAREEKLAGLFNGALDAIVELDRDFRFVMINPAAVRLLGCDPEQETGKSFAPFILPQDLLRLKKIVHHLERRPPGKRNVWVPHGLTLVARDQRKITAEATLSLIEIDRVGYCVLIVRDIGERQKAESLIEALRFETEYLKDELRILYDSDEIIGRSRRFLQTLQLAAQVAPTDSTVLLCGETGTGKELIARAIHKASLRKTRPLIIVNCAAIPENLVESEFFGHAKGAFTGATQHRQGRFLLADGGTIFLDEIGELNKELQSKLLRVLQEGEFSPVGSSNTIRSNVRVIAATNRDLSQAVQSGIFRTDLFYRLSVFPIVLPSLKERQADIQLLAEYFIQKYSKKIGRSIAPLTNHCIERLKSYDWPGNVRELQNVIERGVITARQGRINLEYALPLSAESTKPQESMLDNEPAVVTLQQFHQLEHANLLRALESCHWRVAGKNGAAQLLGMPASTLHSRMKALGIKRPHDLREFPLKG
jgi:PAS domain S-box-containing protein